MDNNQFFHKLHALYFELNNTLLESLKNHCLDCSDNLMTLEELIQTYAYNVKHNKSELRYITQLHNTVCISDQIEFYEYIENMLYSLEV